MAQSKERQLQIRITVTIISQVLCIILSISRLQAQGKYIIVDAVDLFEMTFKTDLSFFSKGIAYNANKCRRLFINKEKADYLYSLDTLYTLDIFDYDDTPKNTHYITILGGNILFGCEYDDINTMSKIIRHNSIPLRLFQGKKEYDLLEIANNENRNKLIKKKRYSCLYVYRKYVRINNNRFIVRHFEFYNEDYDDYLELYRKGLIIKD